MEIKNKAQKKVEKKHGMFLNLGVLVALVVVVSAFEWRTPLIFDTITSCKLIEDPIEIIMPTVIPPPPKPPKPIVFIVPPEPVDNNEPEPDDFESMIDNEIEAKTLPVAIETPEPENVEEVVVIAEVMPEPLGGMSSFYNYVREELKYPRKARNLDIQGKVFVQFVIDKQGNITEVMAIKGIGGGCDEEAVRVIQKAPGWAPGKQRGIPVNVRMVMPITFSLGK